MDTATGGLFSIVIGIIEFVIAIVWLVFPFVIFGKMNKANKHLAEIEQQLARLNYKSDKETLGGQ